MAYPHAATEHRRVGGMAKHVAGLPGSLEPDGSRGSSPLLQGGAESLAFASRCKQWFGFAVTNVSLFQE
jgi:hypothetical protein